MKKSRNSYRRYKTWCTDFCKKLPSYQDGTLTYTVNALGKERYSDGVYKHNKYIPEIPYGRVKSIHFYPYSSSSPNRSLISSSRSHITRCLAILARERFRSRSRLT